MDKKTERATRRRYYDIGLEIERQLRVGKYQPGDKLPSERELSEQFNTSRATIREAIIMLELKELVEVRQGAGIFFNDSDNLENKPKADHATDLNSVGPFELLQARFVLETSIVEFAAENIKLSELKELRAIIHEQEGCMQGDGERFEELDRQFHLCIAEATQNRVLIETAKRFWNVVRTENPLWKQLNTRYLHEGSLKESWLAEHKQIFAALQLRDPKLARETMLAHLQHSKCELSKLIDFDDADTLHLDDYFFT